MHVQLGIGGARAEDLEHVLQWLASAGMAHWMRKIEKSGILISAYADRGFVKMNMFYAELVRRMAQVLSSSLLQSPLVQKLNRCLGGNLCSNQTSGFM